MYLESLKLKKFSDKVLKKEQLFTLNGGLSTATSAGTICTPHGQSGTMVLLDYGYDRQDENGTTYHNRSNIRECL